MVAGAARTRCRLPQLAQRGCRRPNAQRCARELGEGPRVRKATEFGPESPRLQVRVLNQVRHVVNGREGQPTLGGEALQRLLRLGGDELAAHLGRGARCGDIQAAAPQLGEPVVEAPPPNGRGHLGAFLFRPTQQVVQGAFTEDGHLEAQHRIAVRAPHDAGQLEPFGHQGRAGAAQLAGARRVGAGVGGIAGGIHQRPHHGRLGGHVKVLADAGSVAPMEGDGDVRGRLRTGVERRLRHGAHRQRRTIWVALQPHQAAGRLHGELGGRRVGRGPVAAEGRDGSVDDMGKALRHAQRVTGLDENIRIVEKRRGVFRHHAALADPEGRPVEGFAVPEGRQAAALAAFRRLHLNHFRAQFRQNPASQLAPAAGGIDDANVVERRGHVHVPAAWWHRPKSCGHRTGACGVIVARRHPDR